jgi:hypothetical protein
MEVVKSSSARVSLTVEEMMDLETCRYINFSGIRVIDLEAPQLLEKEYEVVAEQTSNEPPIMETIASVSKALQEYERTGSFASAAATDAEDTALAAPTAHVELTEDASIPPQVNEGRDALPPRSVEVAGAPALVAKPGAVEAEGVETLVLDEPATITQESAAPETMTRATTLEIQEVEETGASLSQGAVGGEARTLELACTSWAATSRVDADSKDDEGAAACHTLERGMTWARCAFDELILPATSVSSLVKDSF